MKQTFIFIFFIFFAEGLFAQFADRSHMQVLTGLLQQNKNAEVASKAASSTYTVHRERIIAQSTRDNTAGSLVDSFNLRYTGLKGSTYDYNSMIYAYNYPYSTSPMFNFLGVFTKPQVLFDTCTRWTVNPFTNVYGQYELNYAGYDTSKNLTSFRDIFIDSTHNDNMSYANSFNSHNNIATGYWFNLNLGIPDSAFKQYFEYNSSNKLVKDSVYELHLGVWRQASKTTYTYDGSNNLIQVDQYSNTTDTSFLLPLIEQQKYVNTYDASNRLLTVLTSLYNGTSLAASMKDTFAYSGTLTYCNSWKQYQFDPINNYWAPIISVQKHITASLPDTVNTYSFDSLLNSWVPQERDIVHYDTAHNPDTMRMYLYDWTSYPATPNYTKVYYYNSYIDTVHDTSTLNVAVMERKALVYPNPATNTLTISQPDIPANSGISITFINAAGQMVSRQATRWRDDMQLSIADLAPGSYWLVVQSSIGNIVVRQQVVKQ